MRYALAMMVMTSLLAAGAAVAGVVSIGDYTGAPGDAVTVSVVADAGVTNVAAAGIGIDLRTSTPAGAPQLAFGTIKAGGFWPPSALIAPNVGGVGGSSLPLGMAYVGIVTSEARKGPGDMLIFQVKIPETAPAGTVYSLIINRLELSDVLGKPVAATTKNGSLRVVTGQQGKISVKNVAAGPGDTVVLEVEVDENVKGFSGIGFTLLFDVSLKVDGAKVAVGPLLQGGLVAANTQTPGRAIIGATAAGVTNGPGVVVKVPVTVPTTAKPGEVYPIEIQSVELSDITGKILPSPTPVPGKIVVGLTKAPGALVVRDAKGKPGSVVVVQVTANDQVRDITGAELDLDFRSSTPASAPPISITKAEDIKAGAMFPNALVAANLKTPGTALIGIAGAKAVSGPGVVAEIPFLIPKTAAKNTAYSIKMTAKVAYSGVDLPIDAVGGTILVEQPRRKGDVNGDDKISVTDATMALNAALRLVKLTNEQFWSADLNDDGTISISEVTKILRAALNLDIIG
ncbi:MAG: cohesin domain-containing protein [Armatimonadota bacterium]